ncbi:MAG: YgdI/YgdR family lipoprotein [Duncaniella sp.]|nr:YgdI/YgdR family lipoprotein [Duncaniella sp.]
MKKFLSLFLVAIGLLSLSGCSSYSLINSESYVGADLSSYHTFRIITVR